MQNRERAALIVSGVLVMGAAACGRSGNQMDAELKRDLATIGSASVELAPKAGQQMVVSAIEGGPAAAPARASVRKPAREPAKSAAIKPVERVATNPNPALEERAVEVAAAPPTPAVEPAPLPPMTRPQTRAKQTQQQGPYKTEAEIFRQMPWIRP